MNRELEKVKMVGHGCGADIRGEKILLLGIVHNGRERKGIV